MKNKLKFLALPLIIALTLSTSACSWLTTFDQWVSVAGPVIIQILDLVALAKGTPVSLTTQNKIENDAKNVQALAQSVNEASTADLPSRCAAFNLAISTFASDVPTLESLGQITNPTTKAQVADAISLVQSTIQEIETPVAACQLQLGEKAIHLYASQVKSPREFAKGYNKIMARDHATDKFRVKVPPFIKW